MKKITLDKFSTDEIKNQTGQRLIHDWSKLPYAFPLEYREFLELFNGYCGFLGASYVDWIQFEELVEANTAYEMQKWHPNMTFIGSDGGGMGYAINLHGQFVTFDMTGDYVGVLADNFDDFVEYVYRDDDVAGSSPAT